MPWSTSTFTLTYDWSADLAAGEPTWRINAAKMMTQEQDLADGLEACIKHNGDIAASANLPMGGFLHTNTGAATARTNYTRVAELQDSSHTWIAGGGTVSAITATYAPAVTALTNGMLLGFRCSGINTSTTPTFAPNGLTAKTIVKGANTALALGDLIGNHAEYFVRYNSTTDKWHLLNPTTGFADGTTVVNNGGTLEVAIPRNAQTGTTYTVLTGDRGKHITFSNGSSIAVTLPQAGSAGFLLGWWCIVESIGAGVTTITPTTSTINGAATLALTFGAAQAYLITSDGTNYRALPLYYYTAVLNDFTTDSTIGAVGDFLPFVDVSDSNASNKGTIRDLMYNYIGNETEDTDPDANADYVLTRDESASAPKKTLLKNLKPREVIIVAVGDETTAITTGTAKVTFRMPFAMTLTAVRASLSTASSSGNPAVDVNEGGVSIFSTTLTIDANEKTSTTAATPAVISDTTLADDAEMTIDIDTAGTGAKGLKVSLIGYRT